MIEKIVTSKTRVKLLELYLTHIDDRYYLRELERLLNESLSPLRRQLLKLQNMGILTVEHEASLKYYRLNKNFVGIEELRKLVLRPSKDIKEPIQKQETIVPVAEPPKPQITPEPTPRPQPVAQQRRMKYDLVVLVLVSLFVLGTSAFVVYTSTKNITQVTGMIQEKAEREPRVFSSGKKRDATMPDEMISRRWKVRAGNMPVLSSGLTDKKKGTEEL